MKNKRTIKFLVSLLCFSVTIPLFSEESNLKEQFALAQKENADAILHYTWKSRTELKVKGEVKKVKLEQVQHEPDGKLQKIPLEESQPQEQQQQGGRRGGRLKQKVVENKKEEFADLMQQLVIVAQSYAHIPKEKMQAFLNNAQISAVDEKTVQVSGRGMLNESDSMNIWLDRGSFMIKRVEIATSLDSKPVTLTSEYLQITSGPSVQSKAALNYPDKQIVVTIDNFDHRKL
jgi:hypothetical protein